MLEYKKELVRNKCDVYINTHAYVEDSGVSVKVIGVFNVPLRSLLKKKGSYL